MGFQWLPAEFQSASFANKGRNGLNGTPNSIYFCFNPLPLRTKEETINRVPSVRKMQFQSASFANKGRNSGSKAPQRCIRKRLIAFSRHNNCESVCAILNKR
ncbi:hypothetical protein [Leptospira kirschneri]|uniref:hypothetical protein n=1 Tax=Leptospira kirschneri TaxID=29507 RepID=UPI0015C2D9CD|nr:hypothetical protein [Leptospira kirschneri]